MKSYVVFNILLQIVECTNVFSLFFDGLYEAQLIDIDSFKAWAKSNAEANERLGQWLADKIEEEAQKLAEMDDSEEEE